MTTSVRQNVIVVLDKNWSLTLRTSELKACVKDREGVDIHFLASQMPRIMKTDRLRQQVLRTRLGQQCRFVRTRPCIQK